MRLLFVTILFITSLCTSAQIKQFDLEIHGLVCSLCTRSVEKALIKLPFVSEVSADLENTITKVKLRPESQISLVEMDRAIKQAGFSLGSVKLTLDKPLNESEDCIKLDEGLTVRLLKESTKDKYQYQIIDSELSDKATFKKWESLIPKNCNDVEKTYFLLPI